MPEQPNAHHEVPTKRIVGPDGAPIDYPNLPNVGEPYRPPDPHPSRDASEPHEHSATPAVEQQPATPVHESWRARLGDAFRSTVEHVESYGRAAADALILDDWKALTDRKSTPLERLAAGADLASWAIPEGKVAEIAGHALTKAGQYAAVKIAEHAAEHAAIETAEHTAAASIEGALVAGAVRKPYVPHWNSSDIWERPLTDAERAGGFRTADDAKALLGPAGKGKDWHHIVEAQTEHRFGAERVHNVDNLAAIERDPVHRDISDRFQRNNPRLGPGPDGHDRSLRTYLQDRPWNAHVAEGERALQQYGLRPGRVRAETLERFEQRVDLHDRLLERTGSLRSGDAELHLERNGALETLPPGRHFQGTIQTVDGDRIVQHIGRGETVTWSREELSRLVTGASDKGFEDALQPGRYINVGIARDGIVDVQHKPQGLGWESVGGQPLQQWQQLEALTVEQGRDHGLR